MFPYLIQGKNIVVVIGNQSHTISPSHISYEKIKEAIKANTWDVVQDLIEPKKVVLNYGKGFVAIQGDKVFWKGEVLNTSLTNRLISMFQEGFPIEPMVNFMENLMENPSKRAVNELYKFLEKGRLPITPDGYFLAYKKVNDSYKDCHTNSVLNKPAALLTPDEQSALPVTANGVTTQLEGDRVVVSMARNAVDDDKDRTCSTGLHFCSQEYLSQFGGAHTLILKINPRDVVSIPSDYNNSKGRCCRYEIVGEVGENPEAAFTRSVQDAASF